jgi:hypothetical protein
LPKEIPDPEQTGEERALVSANAQVKTKTSEEDDDTASSTDDVLGPDDTESGTDIVIPIFTEEVQFDDVEASSAGDIATSTLDETHTLDLSEEVELVTETSDETRAHIEDVVVTPFAQQVSIPVTSADSQ